jgi:hypothetical protein
MATDDQFQRIHKLGLILKFLYSTIGLLLGLACILAGVVLGLSGVVGNTKFVASFIGLKTELSDAAPGVVVFIVGIFFVLITRFKVDGWESIRHFDSNHPINDRNNPVAISNTPSKLSGSESPEEMTPDSNQHGPQSHGGSTVGVTVSRGISYHTKIDRT